MDLSTLQSRELVERASRLVQKMAPSDELRFLHVCGTHESTVTRYGIRTLLPPSVKIVAGPGCPVCVTSTSAIDQAVEISRGHATVFTYGDMFAVPGSRESLKNARASGARVKVVYSVTDALSIAEDSGEESTFFSIGFETTAPATAAVIEAGVPGNLTFLTSHRLIPPALLALLRSGRIEIDGLICPGHVSTIIGTKPYEPIVEEFGVPIVVSGFEPLDVMLSIVELVRQVKSGRPAVYNEYTRSVRTEGNKRAIDILHSVFQTCDADWRGIGTLPDSGLELREEYSHLGAAARFRLHEPLPLQMPPGCKCSEVLLGSASPTDCPQFGSGCTPEAPVGPCMVSGEGTCRIWFLYGGRKEV